VVLESLRGPAERDPAAISGAVDPTPAEIMRIAIGDDARRTYADLEEATEEGAEAIAYLVASRVMGRVVFSRLPKKSGGDWKMRPRGAPPGDTYERLEVSGIGAGSEKAAARLQTKLDQLARYPGTVGYAIVTRFRSEPVEVLVGRAPA
jgi:hypothetical protein